MITKLLMRTSRTLTQQRYGSSGFNKNPALKLRSLGYSGNAWMASGTIAIIVAIIGVQRSGYLIPQADGVKGLYSLKNIPMDLTPDELLEKQ